MKKTINTFALVLALSIPFGSYAKDVESISVVNQLSAPAYWQFHYDIRTIGQAINQVLSATNLKVSPTLSTSIVGIMKQGISTYAKVIMCFELTFVCTYM